MFRRKPSERIWCNVVYHLNDGHTTVSAKIYTNSKEFTAQVDKARKKDRVIWVTSANLVGVVARQVTTVSVTACSPHEIPEEN